MGLLLFIVGQWNHLHRSRFSFNHIIFICLPGTFRFDRISVVEQHEAHVAKGVRWHRTPVLGVETTRHKHELILTIHLFSL
jgi:hypothetical protein